MDVYTIPMILAAVTGPVVEEPSEPAMRAAFESRISAQVQGALDFVLETGGPEAVARIRAAGTDKFEIHNFQKLNCARSATKPGYVCGFMVDLGVVNGELQSLLVGRFFPGSNGLDLDLGS
jgi:hypothetical protein